MASFPERLKQLRKDRGAAQKDIAMHVGVSVRAYQFYESGDKQPQIDRLAKLAEYFGVSIDYLLGQTDDPSPSKKISQKSSSLADRGELDSVDDFGALREALKESVFKDLLVEMTSEQRKGFAHMLVDYMNQNEKTLEELAKARGFWPTNKN